MSNEITPSSPRPIPQEVPQEPQTQATAAEDAKRSAANQANEAAKAAQVLTPQIQDELGQPSDLSFEFLTVFETVFQEGYENYKPPMTDAGSGVHPDTKGHELKKEMQIIREFLREGGRLAKEQNLEVRHMIYRLKAEQGGAFWDKLQQILQKGLPGQGGEILGKTLKELETNIRAKGLGSELGGEKELAKSRGASSGSNPLSDFLKAESNPQTKVEAYIAILQNLKREGLPQSSEKLMSYLQHKWGMDEEQMRLFLQSHGWGYFQGPMPKKDKELPNPWYLLIAVLTVPLTMALGLRPIPAIAVGFLALLTVLFVKRRPSNK